MRGFQKNCEQYIKALATKKNNVKTLQLSIIAMSQLIDQGWAVEAKPESSDKIVLKLMKKIKRPKMIKAWS